MADVWVDTLAADAFSYRDHRVALWPVGDRTYGLIFTRANTLTPRSGEADIVDPDPAHQTILREAQIVF